VKTVFLLMMFLNDRPVDVQMRFFDLAECQWFAKELARQYGYSSHYPPHNHKVITYCVPEEVNPKLVRVY